MRASGERRGDVSRHAANGLRADDVRLSDRRRHDGGDLLHPRERRNQIGGRSGGAGDVARRVARDRVGSRVVGQVDSAEVRAIGTGLQDRAQSRGPRDRSVPGVDQVGVAGEQHIDRRRGLAHDGRERCARVDRLSKRCSGVRSLVILGHDDLSLAIGGVSVGELSRHPVDRLDRIAEIEISDASRKHQSWRLLRHHTDHGNAHAVDLVQRVLLKGGVLRALVVDIRTKVGKRGVVTAVDHAIGQIGEATVELVVTHRRARQVQRVQHIDRRLVFGVGRGIQARADVVSGREQQRIPARERHLGALLLNGSRHIDRVGIDASVEVVEVEQRHVHLLLRSQIEAVQRG